MVKGEKIVLHGVLADPIRSDWIDRKILGNRQLTRFSVGSPGAGDIDEVADFAGHGFLDQIDRAKNVHLGIEYRLADSAPHIHLSGMMIDRFGPKLRQGFRNKRAIANVAMEEAGFGTYVCTGAA